MAVELPINLTGYAELDAALQKSIQGHERLNKSVVELNGTQQKYAQAVVSAKDAQVKGLVESNANLNQQKGLLQGVADKIKKLEEAKYFARSEKEIAKYNKKLVTARKEFERLNASSKKGAKEQIGIIGQLNNKLDTLRKKRDAANNPRAIRAYNKQLRGTEKQLGKLTRTGGGSFKMFGGLKTMFAGAFGIYAAIRGIKSMISTITNFQSSSATLAGILGKTRKEIKPLTKEAERLGKQSAFTATQVLELQTELAKLGFKDNQIIAAGEDLINLAVITGDAAQAARVAASTIKQFGLEAKDTGRVVDVLAKSFSSSALDINKFETAMGNVGPVASKLGLSLEDTTSLLGALVDTGLDASTASTSLRNILLNLADSGSELSKQFGDVTSLEDLLKGFDKLAASGADLGEAFELSDKRSVAAFSTFIKGADGVRKLSKELENALGAAKTFAEVKLDTVAGQAVLLGSAWEGLILSLENGSGGFARAIQSVLKGVTSVVEVLTDWGAVKLSEQLQEESDHLGALVTQLSLTEDGTIARKDAVDALNLSYPDFLKNIDTEKLDNTKLAEELQKVNKQYAAKILLQRLSEATDAAREDANENEVEANTRKLRQAELLYKARLKLNDQTVSPEGAVNRLLAIDGEDFSTLQKTKQLAGEISKELVAVNAANEKWAESTKEVTAQESKQSEMTRILIAQFPELAEALSAISGIQAETTSETADATEDLLTEQQKAAKAQTHLNSLWSISIDKLKEFASEGDKDAKRILKARLKAIKANEEYIKSVEKLHDAESKSSENEKIADLQAKADQANKAGLFGREEGFLKDIAKLQSKAASDEIDELQRTLEIKAKLAGKKGIGIEEQKLLDSLRLNLQKQYNREILGIAAETQEKLTAFGDKQVGLQFQALKVEERIAVSRATLAGATEAEILAIHIDFAKQRLELQKSTTGGVATADAEAAIAEAEVAIQNLTNDYQDVVDSEAAGGGAIDYSSLFGLDLNKLFDTTGFDLQTALKLTPEEFAKVSEEIEGLVQQVGTVVTNALNEVLFEAPMQANDIYLEMLEERIEATRAAIERESEFKKLGLANDVDAEKEKLAALQSQEKKAQKEKEKLQKKERIVNAAMTVSNMVLAVAGMIRANAGAGIIGVAIAAAGIAAMFSLFAAFKGTAKSAAYFEGTSSLKRGDNPKGRDTIPIMAHEGERIVPTKMNNDNWNIYEGIQSGNKSLIRRGLEETAAKYDIEIVRRKRMAREVVIDGGKIEALEQKTYAVKHDYNVHLAQEQGREQVRYLKRIAGDTSEWKDHDMNKTERWFEMPGGTRVEKTGNTTRMYKVLKDEEDED